LTERIKNIHIQCVTQTRTDKGKSLDPEAAMDAAEKAVFQWQKFPVKMQKIPC
jgi:hypothetical protein